MQHTSATSSNTQQALAVAREHCFNAGVGDGAMNLCAAVAQFGVAKLQHVQEVLGYEPDAMFVGAPDATVTRNRVRWCNGFGYGGTYSWTGDFTVLDIKPNCCGMMVGTLKAPVDPVKVRQRVERLRTEPIQMEGVTLDWDFDVGNHFVDLCTLEPGGAEDFSSEHFFILHTAGREFRGPTAMGPGLYYDKSEVLRGMARQVETPWGSLLVLERDAADEWYQFYNKAQAFALRRRQALATEILGEHEVVCDVTHQGMVRGISQANLGCYTYETSSVTSSAARPLFPLTLSKDLPAYLLRGRQNFSRDAMVTLGWLERAERLELVERLSHANVLPHGGGYTYPGLVGVDVVDRGADGRSFQLTWDDGRQTEITDPRDLEYEFRAHEVYERVQELGLADVVGKMNIDHAVVF